MSTTNFSDDAAALEREALASVAAAPADHAALESVRNQWIGRKGRLRDLFARLGTLPPEEKGPAGALLNQVKESVSAVIDRRIAGIGSSATAVARDTTFDITLPGTRPRVGGTHLVYQTMEEIVEILARLGFEPIYGPEVEKSYYNFEALNIPVDHPARDAFDTFYLGGPWLLRSHTSPVQIRTMQQRKPPLRVSVPGKVFRPDTADASHFPMFHQVEGLMVDEGVSFADLKGVLAIFAKDYFGAKVEMRFRPSFFPLTEPSAEVDISCLLCGGPGCPACKQSGWIEILGAGMVHPRVLQNVGYDTEKYTGFAFGMGVERIAMLKHRVTDIRLLTENHAKFLAQF